MSPTLSDDLLVRDLHQRADRLLPPMALDPTDVLVAGRRRRNRQTALRSVAGVLAAGAFVVGALQLAGPNGRMSRRRTPILPSRAARSRSGSRMTHARSTPTPVRPSTSASRSPLGGTPSAP